MSPIVQELEKRLQELDPATARIVEQLVRDALALAAARTAPDAGASSRPEGYFERTAGALAGEQFERPPQGDVPKREEW